MKKIKSIFGSVRFWQLAVIAAIQVLVVLDVINTNQGEQLALIVQGLLAASVTVGTADSIAVKSAPTTVLVEAPVASTIEELASKIK